MAQPSRNVVACKALKCTQALSRGLWNNGVLSPYLFILCDQSKTAVGLVQGLFGLATAVLALPAGILSDKTARHYVSKLSAVLDSFAICFTSSAILSNHHKYHLLSIGALFWGLSVACDSNTDALFADSIPAAERSTQFTQLQALSMACLGAGPLIAAAIFHAQGDQWTLHALGIVILCGMAASVVPLAIKLVVHDKYTLGTEAEAVTEFLNPQNTAHLPPSNPEPSSNSNNRSQTHSAVAGSPAATASTRPQNKRAVAAPPCKAKRLPVVHSGAELRLSCDDLPPATEGAQVATIDQDSAPEQRSMNGHAHGSNGVAIAPLIEAQEDPAEARLLRAAMLLSHQMAGADGGGANRRRGLGVCCFRFAVKPEWIPVMVFSADVVMGLASGMTIKFFPIFFMKKSMLTPMENSLLAASTPVAIASGIFVIQRLANVVGRVPAILTFRWLGVALLLMMAFAESVWSVKAIILPLYLARTACANCTSALARSILMDFVSKKHRGKWSCLDGVTIFGWSGSAVVGGMLLDRYGFRLVFIATAAMQLLGSMCIVTLLPVVSAFENALKAAAHEESSSAVATGPQAAPPSAAADLEYEAASQHIKSVSSFSAAGCLPVASPTASASSPSTGGARRARQTRPAAHRVSIDSEQGSLDEPLLPGTYARGSVLDTSMQPASLGFRRGSLRVSMDGSEEIETGFCASTFTGTG